MQSLKAITKSFINLLYPLHCLGCGKALEAVNEFHLCAYCIGSIKPNAMPPFELEAVPVKAYSACLYEGSLKELIHKFKYKGKTALSKIFGRLMIDCINENPELASLDIVTAVPLHKKRLREREFNQSLLLAAPISEKFNIPMGNLLEKVRKTKYQNELLKSERLANLKGAFKVSPGAQIRGKNVLLIDDVMTTGATLGECAKTLLDGGVRSVTCLTLARSI